MTLPRVHHLNDSRSQKTVWLLEELGCPFEVVPHLRDPATLKGPPALKAAHPIGKAPVLEAEGRSIVESGAIADYLLARHDDGALVPDREGADFLRYLEWMHFAVSIGSTPVMFLAWGRAFALDESTFMRAAVAEMDHVLRYLEDGLKPGPYLMGEHFTAADIQVSFVAELGREFHSLDAYPRINAWLGLLYERPAYQRAIADPVPYRFGGARG
jgi:glutathione S-transferase